MEAPRWLPSIASHCWLISPLWKTRASTPRSCIHYRKSCSWCCLRPLRGADDFVEAVLWGKEQLAFVRRFYRYEPGILSHDTLCDVFEAQSQLTKTRADGGSR